MKLFFLVFLFLFSCSAPKNTEQISKNVDEHPQMLPVWVTYLGYQPPDSIKDFIRVYLQSKKIEVIGVRESIDMLMQRMQTLFSTNPITDNMTGDEYLEKNKEVLNKRNGNVLGIHLFCNNKKGDDFLIDSIKWYVKPMPVTDTIKVYTPYYPSYSGKEDVYTVLKSFSDMVLASTLIK